MSIIAASEVRDSLSPTFYPAYLELREGIRIFPEGQIPPQLEGAQILSPYTDLIGTIVQVGYALIQDSPFLRACIDSASTFREKIVIQGDRVFLQVPTELAQNLNKLYRVIQDSFKQSRESQRPSDFFRNPELVSACDFFGLPLFGQSLVDASGEELDRLVQLLAEVQRCQNTKDNRISFPVTNEECLIAFSNYMGRRLNFTNSFDLLETYQFLIAFERNINSFTPSQLMRFFSKVVDNPKVFPFVLNFVTRRRPEFLKSFSAEELGDFLKLVSRRDESFKLFIQQAHVQGIDLKQIPIEKFHEAFLIVCNIKLWDFQKQHGNLIELARNLEIPLLETLPDTLRGEALIQLVGKASPRKLNQFLSHLPGGLSYLNSVSLEQTGRLLIAFASSGFCPDSDQQFISNVMGLIERFGGLNRIDARFIKEARRAAIFNLPGKSSFINGILSGCVELTPEDYQEILLKDSDKLSSEYFFDSLEHNGVTDLPEATVSQVLLNLKRNTLFNMSGYFRFLARTNQLGKISPEALNHVAQMTYHPDKFVEILLHTLSGRIEDLSTETFVHLLSSPSIYSYLFSKLLEHIGEARVFAEFSQRQLNQIFIQNAIKKERIKAIFKLFKEKNVELDLTADEVGQTLVKSSSSPEAFEEVLQYLVATKQLLKLPRPYFERALANLPANKTFLGLLDSPPFDNLALTPTLSQALVNSLDHGFSTFSTLFKYFESRGELVNLQPHFVLKILIKLLQKYRKIEEIQLYIGLLLSSSAPLLKQLTAEDFNAFLQTACLRDVGNIPHRVLSYLLGPSGLNCLDKLEPDPLKKMIVKLTRDFSYEIRYAKQGEREGLKSKLDLIFDLKKRYNAQSTHPLFLPQYHLSGVLEAAKTWRDTGETETDTKGEIFKLAWREFVVPYLENPERLNPEVMRIIFILAPSTPETLKSLHQFVRSQHFSPEGVVDSYALSMVIKDSAHCDETIQLLFTLFGKRGTRHLSALQQPELRLLMDFLSTKKPFSEALFRHVISEFGTEGSDILHNLPVRDRSTLISFLVCDFKRPDLAEQFRAACRMPLTNIAADADGEVGGGADAAEEQQAEHLAPATHTENDIAMNQPEPLVNLQPNIVEPNDNQVDHHNARTEDELFAALGPIQILGPNDNLAGHHEVRTEDELFAALGPIQILGPNDNLADLNEEEELIQPPGRIAQMCQALTDAIRLLTGSVN